MDDLLYALFIGPALLIAVNTLLGAIAQLRLLRELPGIHSERDMMKFKHFAAMQMYHALFQMAASGVVLIAAAYALVAHDWSAQRVLLCGLPTILVSCLGVFLKVLESRIKKLPVGDEFRAEFERVVHVWMTKPFPNW